MKLITEEVVRSFLSNPLLVAEFPFLKPPPVPEEGCCGKKKRHNLTTVKIPPAYFNDIKKAIAQLPDARLNRLLEMAAIEKPIRLIYRENNAVVDVRR